VAEPPLGVEPVAQRAEGVSDVIHQRPPEIRDRMRVFRNRVKRLGQLTDSTYSRGAAMPRHASAAAPAALGSFAGQLAGLAVSAP
jgi:hypothetical protein